MNLQPPPARPANAPRRNSAASRQAVSAANKTRDSRAETLGGFVQLASLGLSMIGMKKDAGALDVHSPGIIPEVVKLADDNEKIAAWIDNANKIGPYGALTMAILPLALQIATNHNMVKAAGTMGVVAPELLETMVNTKQMKAAAEHAQMQKDLQEEANLARQALEEANA